MSDDKPDPILAASAAAIALIALQNPELEPPPTEPAPPLEQRPAFGRYAAGYDLSAATTVKDQVRLIGNSVPPEQAEAVIRANVGERAAEAA